MLRTLVEGLSRAGVDVHVATTEDGVEDERPVVRDSVTWWRFRRQTGFYKFSWPLNRWLEEHVGDYGIVHIHALFSFAPVAAAYWARRKGVPYIVRPLGVLNQWGMKNRRPGLKRWSFRLIESRILENAAWVHFTSEQECEEASKLGVRMRSKVIANPLPAAVRARAGGFRGRYPELQERRIVLFLSRIDHKKGLDLLLPAFAAVRRDFPDAALVIAGAGDAGLESELRAKAESLGIAKSVCWPGFIEGEEKQEAFADADVFVLPSYSENFGIAAAEALAAGCAVIVSDQVAIEADVRAGQAGMVVPCDIERIAQAIRRMLADDRARAGMAANGRALAEANYSIESVTRKLLSAYAETGQTLQYA